MDQELKQRLIGASVIIALAIIFIPMLFDNEVDKSDDNKIDIVIPESGSHPLSVKTFSLDDEQSNEEPAEVTLPESELSLVDDSVIGRDAVEGNGIVDASEDLPVSNTSENEEKPVAKPQKIESETTASVNNPSVAADKSAETEEVGGESDHKPQSDVDNVAKSKPVTKDPDDEKNIYRVKLGSFSKAENAQQVKNKLAQKGIGSLVELAPERALYRVWSEALYRDKAKADAYVAAVNKLNLNIGTPKIIALSEAEVKAGADRGQLGWVVQLGSFSAKNNALDLRNKLKLAGFTAFVDVSQNRQGETRYRLRVGPVNNQEQATQLKQQISNKLKLNGLVKTHELASLVD